MFLSTEQIDAYRRDGFLTRLPALSPDEVREAQAAYARAVEMLPPGVKVYDLAQWEKHNDFFFGLVSHPRILDYAESLCGPNFYVWDSYLFTKDPHEDVVSQAHFDKGSWPMGEGRFATVFLALYDATIDNGCLWVSRGSHRRHHRHRPVDPDTDRKRFFFHHQVPAEEIEADSVEYLELAAGEVSLHHELTVHGSNGNRSDAPRVGFAIRYASSDVEANLTIWPEFSVIPMRGDGTGPNPTHTPPTEFGIPTLQDQPHYRSPHVFAKLKRAWRRVTRPHGPEPRVDLRPGRDSTKYGPE